MNLSTLQPARGAVKHNVKRLGRGQGSGRGGTSTRGHKGAKSRSGFRLKRGFEGGQMPIQRRIPKFGFKNVNRIEYEVFNLDRLNKLAQKYQLTDLTLNTLRQLKVISKTDKVKLLGRGELTAKINVEAHACSAAARKAIEEKGGTVTLV